MPTPSKKPRLFSLQIGAEGAHVTLFERKENGPFWLRWHVSATPTRPKHWAYKSLKHRNRAVAEQTARETAAALLASTLAESRGRATVGDVLAIYQSDVADHLKGSGPKECKRRAALWAAFLSPVRYVDTIDFPTLDRFVRDRRAGRVVIPGGKYTLKGDVTNRAIGADLEYLRAALNHATRCVRSSGARLLERNPVHGYQLPKNKAPNRPVASFDRYLAVVKHADRVDPQRLFRGFMGLVEGLGWRVSAICALRASDVELTKTKTAPHGRIFKAPEFDKEGRGGWVPMSVSVRGAIDRIRSVNPAIGARPLFPAPRATQEGEHGEMPKAWTRHHARKLLERAERRAKLDPVKGSDFHCYRRKWAVERKHLPDVDVAAAGAWGDTRALKLSYQATDERTMLAVVSEPTKLRDAGVKRRARGV